MDHLRAKNMNMNRNEILERQAKTEIVRQHSQQQVRGCLRLSRDPNANVLLALLVLQSRA